MYKRIILENEFYFDQVVGNYIIVQKEASSIQFFTNTYRNVIKVALVQYRKLNLNEGYTIFVYFLGIIFILPTIVASHLSSLRVKTFFFLFSKLDVQLKNRNSIISMKLKTKTNTRCNR